MASTPRDVLAGRIERDLLGRPMGKVHLSLADGAGPRRSVAHFRSWPLPVLQCVVSGSVPLVLRDRTGEREVVLEPGDCCYSVPGGWDLRSYATSRRLLVFLFPPTHIHVHLARHLASRKPGALPSLTYHTQRPLLPEGQALLQALNENALRRGDAVGAWHLLQALGRLVAQALREDRPTATPGAATATYRMLLDYVVANAHRPINRNEVAAAFGLAPDHVSRLFATHGERFNHLVNRLRLDRAAELLRQERAPLQDIAQRCGFASDNYFVKAFRRRFGLPPGAFRGLERGSGS